MLLRSVINCLPMYVFRKAVPPRGNKDRADRVNKLLKEALRLKPAYLHVTTVLQEINI